MRNIRPPRRRDDAAAVRRLRERILAMARHQSLRDPVSAMCEQAQLTSAQVHSILWLGHEGPLTMGDLSRRVGVTVKTGTGLVDRLERAGYAARERDTADRRVVRARLTPRGSAVHRKLDAAIDRKLGRLLAVLDPAERRALERVVDKLSRMGREPVHQEDA
jgi:DNA-binding MarR family transcriptional regulator